MLRKSYTMMMNMRTDMGMQMSMSMMRGSKSICALSGFMS